jgi:hypothetical protein
MNAPNVPHVRMPKALAFRWRKVLRVIPLLKDRTQIPAVLGRQSSLPLGYCVIRLQANLPRALAWTKASDARTRARPPGKRHELGTSRVGVDGA